MSLFDDFLEATESQEINVIQTVGSSHYEGKPATQTITNVTTIPATTPLESEQQQQKSFPSAAHVINDIQSVPSSIFSLDYVQFQLPALLVHMVVSNNILMAILSNNHILRIDLDNPLEIQDIDWARKANDGRLQAVFFDPTGRHLILSTEHGENYYLYSQWKKTKPLTKLKGMVITSIGWNNEATVTSHATREILLGTDQGDIYETWLEPTDDFFKKEERYLQLIYRLVIEDNLSSRRIVGLAVERLHSFHYIVIATTTNRIYQFTGRITSSAVSVTALFASLFARYISNASFQEIPGDIGWSALYFYQQRSSTDDISKRKELVDQDKDIFIWVTGPGIFQARLGLTAQRADSDDLIGNTQLIPYPVSTLQDGTQQTQPDAPISVSLTAFHIIFLYQHRIKVINHLNHKLVFDEAIPLEPNEKVQGLAADNIQKTYWIYTTAAIYEIVIKDEDKDVWQLYLDKQDYPHALAYCKTRSQRNKVHIVQADQLFSKGLYQQSAKYYAITSISFEQAALKFITRNEKDALRVYLLAKLQQLDNKAKTQKSIVATWLVEIYLAKINHYHEMASSVAYTSTFYEGQDSKKGQSALDFYHKKELQTKVELKQLLETYQDYFHRDTIYKLVSSHGHNAELIYYANLMGDNDKVISHWITEKNWDQALHILEDQENLDMFYKYSPILMESVPKETVDIWISHERLNARMLIPSLLRYDHNTVADKVAQHQAIRYLSHVVTVLGNTDPVIHNSLLALYATQTTSDETALLSFLKNEGREMYYNPEYALRLCSQFGRTQSCIHLYSLMGLYEEAVHLALKIGDIDLARTQADKPFGDDEMGKKLWLAIAKYVIQEKKDIKTAMNYLKQSNLLNIEDILPFFPDSILIDDFKDDIYKALEEYNGHIGVLKSEMDDATKSVNNIRLDVRSLKSRVTEIDQKNQCCICKFPLLTRQFYVFPCEHAYHTDCLINKTTKHLPFRQIRKLADIQEQLSRNIKLQNKLQNAHYTGPNRKDRLSVTTTTATAAASATTNIATTASPLSSAETGRDELRRVKARIERLKIELDDIVANECVYCGQIMVDSIDEPFISLEENDLVLDWML